MLKHMVETNEDDLKIATKQAFNIVMQAIAKIESPEGFHQVTSKKIVKKVRYMDLINVISKLNLELNFTSDDVVFIPEDKNGHILYSIRSEKNPNNDRQVRLLLSIPIMALYKKKILYNSVRDRPLLGESDEVPTNSTTKHLLQLIKYGYTRPLMAGAIITFAWPIDYKIKKKAGDAELFGFYVQLPQRKPYLRYI
uniref:Uncharacterized protein n=1 Tax=Acrobeloides nanus TaxID=290746 RepID=A0A914DRV6_9BILA